MKLDTNKKFVIILWILKYTKFNFID